MKIKVKKENIMCVLLLLLVLFFAIIGSLSKGIIIEGATGNRNNSNGSKNNMWLW